MFQLLIGIFFFNNNNPYLKIYPNCPTIYQSTSIFYNFIKIVINKLIYNKCSTVKPSEESFNFLK